MASESRSMDIVDAGDTEEFAEQFEGADVLEPKQVIEGVDKLFALGAEDLVEYFFVVIADDLR
jgi:hypothetical protein